MTRKTLQKPAKWLGYSAFFSAALFGSLYLTFPYEALRTRIIFETKKHLGVAVQIGSIRLSGLTGIKLRDVSIPFGEEAAAEGNHDTIDATADDDASGQSPPSAPVPAISVDSATARLELLPLLRGRTAVQFDVSAWDGELEGRLEQGKDKTELHVKISQMMLAKTPIKPLVGLDLDGLVSGVEVELSSKGSDLSKANGVFTVKAESLTLNGGEVQHFELPKVALGALDAKIVVADGKATIEALQIRGQDIEAQVEGAIKLAARVGISALAGKLKFKPSEEWWNKNELLKNMANFALPASKDGWRTINVSGQLMKPTFKPQK